MTLRAKFPSFINTEKLSFGIKKQIKVITMIFMTQCNNLIQGEISNINSLFWLGNLMYYVSREVIFHTRSTSFKNRIADEIVLKILLVTYWTKSEKTSEEMRYLHIWSEQISWIQQYSLYVLYIWSFYKNQSIIYLNYVDRVKKGQIVNRTKLTHLIGSTKKKY